LEHLGRAEQGLREVERALSEHPQDAALHRARAYLLFRSSRGEEALEEVETLLRLDPDDPAPLRMSGDYLSTRSDFSGARKAYERYLALQPNDSRILFHLGIALQRLGEVEDALAVYGRSVAIDAEFLPARNNLAMLLAEAGRIDAGLVAAQANYARAPEEAVVMDTLAWLYLKKGLAERAATLFERAAQAAPASSEIREHLEEARLAASRPRPVRVPAKAPVARPKGDLRVKLAELGRPHIVLVLVDTLRADWTSPYGFDAEVSPELQRWADGGVVFERALAQSSWTKVSMASLLTSLWPRSHDIRLATDGLAEGALTLAEVLREAGYRTYAVQSNGWLEQSFGFHQGFDRYVFPRTERKVGHARSPSLWPHGERVLEEASRILEARSDASPFFLYLHLMDVHEYAAPPEFKRFGEDKRGHYLAAIRWVDSLLERMGAELARLGLSERSVLIFASDHGEAFGENRSYGHARNVLTPVLHVPLVIRFPFKLEPRRISAQVRNLDIAPTILDIAGVPAPKSFEGSSLLPLIEAVEREGDRTAYAALGAPILKGAIEQVAVNDGSWTLARNLDEAGREFLFDNILDLEPGEAQRMRALLDAHVSVSARAGTRAEDVRIDPHVAERLRSLGYLQ
jgi:arylsulfatase A-like enzyme/Flp pilus assembly protein TadD